jgi:hypothetical protein
VLCTFLCLCFSQRLAYKNLPTLGLGCEDEVADQQVAFAFWFNSSDALPEVCHDGLRSAGYVAKLKVFLLGYQSLKNVPDNVTFVHASQYLEDFSFDS